MLEADKILRQTGLVAFWIFNQGLTALGEEKYTLRAVSGSPSFIYDKQIKTQVLYLKRGEWLRIPREECAELNIHGESAQLSVVAWIKRMKQPPTYDCETIAGIWDESRKKRQYCLFLDLPIWDSKDQIGGHISYHGGPTPNYKYCMDAAIGNTPVTFDRWHFVGFTYDGNYACAYLDGKLDIRDSRNPFYYPQGIYDGGDDGADFTVGAVSRSGEAGNFFHGCLAGLAVFKQALDEVTMQEFANLLV